MVTNSQARKKELTLEEEEAQLKKSYEMLVASGLKDRYKRKRAELEDELQNNAIKAVFKDLEELASDVTKIPYYEEEFNAKDRVILEYFGKGWKSRVMLFLLMGAY